MRAGRQRLMIPSAPFSADSSCPSTSIFTRPTSSRSSVSRRIVSIFTLLPSGRGISEARPSVPRPPGGSHNSAKPSASDAAFATTVTFGRLVRAMNAARSGLGSTVVTQRACLDNQWVHGPYQAPTSRAVWWGATNVPIRPSIGSNRRCATAIAVANARSGTSSAMELMTATGGFLFKRRLVRRTCGRDGSRTENRRNTLCALRCRCCVAGDAPCCG